MSIQQQLNGPVYQLEGFSFYANRDKPIKYPEHGHIDLEIFLLLNPVSAQVTWQTATGQRQRRQLKANQFCVIPSNQPHAFSWQQSAEYILIHFHPKFFKRATREFLQTDRIDIVEQYAIENSLIQTLALTLRSTFESEGATDYLYIDSLVNVLVMQLLKDYAGCQFIPSARQTNPPKRWLKEVIDYIHSSLDQDLRLAKLAKVSKMSESTFCHLFKEYMAISPYKYVIRQRVELAKKLLLKPELSIVEIAFQCGFNNQSHLTIYFRQHTGVTPKVYRNSH